MTIDSVYLTDVEMEGVLKDTGLIGCSDEELLRLAQIYDRLGHADSSCGAFFMRYSIIGFVERRKVHRPVNETDGRTGDPDALEAFIDRYPSLRRLA